MTANLRTLRFEQRRKIRNRYGVLREFDVYWEYELDGVVQRTVIECKDYKSAIQIDKVDALVGKLGDIEGDFIPVFATKTGFQSGTKKAADHHDVELLIVREQDESDWTSEDGQALVRYIKINVTMSVPSSIHDFKPQIDETWIKQNTSIDTSEPLHLSAMNNELFIEDKARQERYSLQDLASRLHPPSGAEYGRFQETRKFEDAYFVHPTLGRLKMLSFFVDFSAYPPLTQRTEIDGGAALLGVIEYVQRGGKN